MPHLPSASPEGKVNQASSARCWKSRDSLTKRRAYLCGASEDSATTLDNSVRRPSTSDASVSILDEVSSFSVC
uniref:Uncharacterized protein n=1 Tax=Utricularia reniformis TaxID=192314 RepID=A0A1Y0B412_9LAMI|nr:hypothetical protein AEK19_MT1989 [Utricularia reniformis]ART32152.1 hypothetical protein AEK19_MT1989 [Utricularia reniformis]